MVVWVEADDENLGEEMVNESPDNPILFAKWSKAGEFIMICLTDGGIILGNVDGE